MNEVYGGYFSAPAPARATIQAAALPRGVRVEIDVVAYLGRLTRRLATTAPATPELDSGL